MTKQRIVKLIGALSLSTFVLVGCKSGGQGHDQGGHATDASATCEECGMENCTMDHS